MIEYDLPAGKRLDLVRRFFGEASTVEELVNPEHAPSSIAPSRLYSYATGLIEAPDPEIERAMEENPRLRSVFRRMLEEAASYYLPEAMAASTEDLPQRDGAGCRIRFEQSRAEPDQVYVIVELTDEVKAPPKTLVVCDAEDRCEQLALPQFRDSVVQFIVEKNSDLLRLLRDPKTKAFLR